MKATSEVPTLLRSLRLRKSAGARKARLPNGHPGPENKLGAILSVKDSQKFKEAEAKEKKGRDLRRR